MKTKIMVAYVFLVIVLMARFCKAFSFNEDLEEENLLDERDVLINDLFERDVQQPTAIDSFSMN